MEEKKILENEDLAAANGGLYAERVSWRDKPVAKAVKSGEKQYIATQMRAEITAQNYELDAIASAHGKRILNENEVNQAQGGEDPQTIWYGPDRVKYLGPFSEQAPSYLTAEQGVANSSGMIFTAKDQQYGEQS